jgi:hypothetical protein
MSMSCCKHHSCMMMSMRKRQGHAATNFVRWYTVGVSRKQSSKGDASMTVVKSLCFVALILLVGFLAPAVSAQTGNATLSGRVTDPHGSVVPHTTIEAINSATNEKTATETNGDGLYYFAALPPGGYRIVVSKDGFKQIIEGGVSLHTQDELTLNFGLQIGSVAETVTVHALKVSYQHDGCIREHCY